MTTTRRWASVVGVVCGAELIVAIVIGSAGAAALLSYEAALVGGLATLAAYGLVKKRRSGAVSDRVDEPDAQVERQADGLAR